MSKGSWKLSLESPSHGKVPQMGPFKYSGNFFFIKRPEDTSLWIEGVMVNGSQLSAPLCDI